MRSSPAGIDDRLGARDEEESGMALMRSALVSVLFSSIVLLAAHPARAEEGQISFCNNFPHTVYIAIAYEQYEDDYISRGWLEVETGKCYVFDTAIRVSSFYFRAESESYRDGRHRVKMVWSGDKKFAVRDANFQAYGAEKAYSGMRLEGFTKSPDSSGGPITAIVTFTETGGSNTTIPAPENPAAQSGGVTPPQAASPPPAEQAAAPTAPSTSNGIVDKSPGGTSSSDDTPSSDVGGNGRDSEPRQ
jgi:uncharacterized membrane protein